MKNGLIMGLKRVQLFPEPRPCHAQNAGVSEVRKQVSESRQQVCAPVMSHH